MNDNFKHTPGPWHISKCSCGHPRCKDYWIDSGSFCQGSGFSEADALLIAAAPDLLQALKRLVARVDPDYTEVETLEAKAAIDKALGR